MPGSEYYEGADLAEDLRRLAEHHVAVENRHISEFEASLILAAADELERCAERDSKDSFRAQS